MPDFANTSPMKSFTEADSLYGGLEHMSTMDLLRNMNDEDKKVAHAVESAVTRIIPLVDAIVGKMQNGGRLFYLGAGTSGRLGVVDASEIPPTFGMPFGRVIGIIAGGDGAIRKAVEFAEDDPKQGWKDLRAWNVSDKDMVIGIAASGRTPYVIGALEECRKHMIKTGCITCNVGTKMARMVNHPVEVIVGPEFVTGSTRMKAGTAQKLVLNMISTAVMIKLGRVKDNKMVDMQLTNNKLIQRGIEIIAEETGLSPEDATVLLAEHGNVRSALEAYDGLLTVG